MKHFFITGLPRTRTGWLSVLFTYGPSICIHEATRFGRGRGPRVFFALAKEEYYDFEYVGNSDSGILSRMPDLSEDFPDSPVAFIDRDIGEVIDSLVKISLVEKSCIGPIGAWMDEKADLFLKLNPYSLMIPYNLLDDKEVISDLWHHLLPEIRFPEHRWEYLKGMHVDMHQPEYMKLLPEEYKEAMK